MDYAKLQEELVYMLDWMKGPFIEYAHTYASNIVRNIEVGARYGDSPEKATKTQLLYVFSNLQGAKAEDILKVEALAKRYGIFDLDDAVRYALGAEEGDEESAN